MKNILIISLLMLTTCIGHKEIQVRHIYLTVMDIEIKERYNQELKIWVHFKGDNRVDYYMEANLADSTFYRVDSVHPFLVNR